MTVHEQGRTLASGEAADHDGAVGVGALRHARERIGGDRLRYLERLDGEAETFELGRDDGLCAGLRADHTGLGDEPLEERERALGQRVDLGVDELGVVTGDQRRTAGRSRESRRPIRSSTSLRPTSPSGRR